MEGTSTYAMVTRGREGVEKLEPGVDKRLARDLESVLGVMGTGVGCGE
jgi:hypothetical protein